ncbi:hypothetical protein IU500_13635 [Nocardia terpenica]|uniref:Uncharacterized protein n=1 Tax=Nocardia terpenica TaxID=455432 RepID=A0A161X920_9NOCA|nr:hypothetical protein [Nocardia terpenica]KZM69598.1 hypothetical protein AWN90_07390 [Nocardia terpenica]MBF6062781.1 hypothetical protein [Nocardia terpenica]MBF6105084.1 hypothetical protein [Nocardia terpenica]MBF6112479.1 hypothetical protein [Nocardia terpenica]MBF6118812.1 hypothetical protein [Nocardia terpenica]
MAQRKRHTIPRVGPDAFARPHPVRRNVPDVDPAELIRLAAASHISERNERTDDHHMTTTDDRINTGTRELEAMRAAYQALTDLDDTARARALRWLTDVLAVSDG